MENNISVALATYNGAAYIEQQLMSIINQTFTPTEIIIIDDFSQDNTVQIIKKIQEYCPHIILKVNERNLGPIDTFKKAIATCSSGFVALSDQDDIWEETKLEICFNEIKNLNQNIPAIVFTDLAIIQADGKSTDKTFWQVQGYQMDKIFFNNVLIGNVVTGCTILMNEQMKKEIAIMPKTAVMHDHWMALIGYGFGNFKAIGQALIKFRIHENNVTQKNRMPLLRRISYFFEVFLDKKKNYMLENILQAESFLELYGSRLNSMKFNQLTKFVSLKNKSSLFRKLYIGYTKYL